MIPRRVYEHVKAHNWFAVAVDLAIVVLGVFLGTQVSMWNEARETRARADVFSARLAEDLRVEAWGYDYLIKYNEDVLANAERTLAALTGEKLTPDEQFLIAAYRATQYKYNDRHRASYDELVSTGAISLIADQKLRETAILVFTTPLLDLISEEAEAVGIQEIFRTTIPAAVQRALLKKCGDRWAAPGDYDAIVGTLDYSCALDLPAEAISAAANALRNNGRTIPALQLRFADVETALTDLGPNNMTVLENLREIAGRNTP